MKKTDLYELAIKIFGFYTVYVLILTSFSLIDIATYYFPDSDGNYLDEFYPMIAGLIVKISLMAFISIYLIFKTKRIASWVCKEEDYTEKVKLYASKQELYELSIRFIGLFVVLWAIPELIMQIGQLTYENASKNILGEREYFPLLSTFLRIVFGAFAILLANSIARYFAKSNSDDNMED